MNSQQATNVRAGYRTVALLLIVGFAGIGLTRLEDRGVIGAPGAPANAMAAFAATASSDAEDGENYDGDPEQFSTLGSASRVPRERIRQALRDRDVARVAARQIVGPGQGSAGSGEGVVTEPETGSVLPELPSIPLSQPVTLASLAPPPPGIGTPVFAADVAPPPGGGGGGGGGGGETPVDPVTPVPEPATWLSMILGLFGLGAVLRHRNRQLAPAGMYSV